MSVMNKEIFEALIDAGASSDKASEAAKSVADYKEDISQLNQKLAVIRGDLTVIKWGVGLIIAVEVMPYLKAMFS